MPIMLVTRTGRCSCAAVMTVSRSMHQRANVAGAMVRGGIGQADPPTVKDDQPAKVGEAFDQPVRHRIFEEGIHRHRARQHQDDIVLAGVLPRDHPVREVRIIVGPRVPNLTPAEPRNSRHRAPLAASPGRREASEPDLSGSLRSS